MYFCLYVNTRDYSHNYHKLSFMFSEEQNLVLLCGPDGLQSYSETTDVEAILYWLEGKVSR